MKVIIKKICNFMFLVMVLASILYGFRFPKRSSGYVGNLFKKNAIYVNDVIESNVPDAPTKEDLVKYLNGRIKIKCSDNEHMDMIFNLLDDSYAIGDVTGTDGHYQSEVYIDGLKYLEEYNGSLKSNHRIMGVDCKKAVFIWTSNNEWVLSTIEGIVFYVKCIENTANTLDKVTITYNTRGGINVPESDSCVLTNNNCIFSITGEIPIKSGYKFVGWSKDSEDVSKTYNQDDKLEISKDITLYAVWEEYDEEDEYENPDTGNYKIFMTILFFLSSLISIIYLSLLKVKRY